jgi:hypothetical protein
MTRRNLDTFNCGFRPHASRAPFQCGRPMQHLSLGYGEKRAWIILPTTSLKNVPARVLGCWADPDNCRGLPYIVDTFSPSDSSSEFYLACAQAWVSQLNVTYSWGVFVQVLAKSSLNGNVLYLDGNARRVEYSRKWGSSARTHVAFWILRWPRILYSHRGRTAAAVEETHQLIGTQHQKWTVCYLIKGELDGISGRHRGTPRAAYYCSDAGQTPHDRYHVQNQTSTPRSRIAYACQNTPPPPPCVRPQAEQRRPPQSGSR